MINEQAKMVEFMQAADQICHDQPTEILDETKYLRGELIHEEWKELIDAMGIREIDGMIMDWEPSTPSNMVEVADAIGDLLYVVLGTAVAYGINITPIFDEIHRSNMTKFIDGHRRDDGKWIKGPSYTPPNLAPILKAQMK